MSAPKSLIRILFMLGMLQSAVGMQAQIPQAKLWTVFPPGVSVNEAAEVTVRGSDLEGELRLVFSDPRIEATPSVNEKGEPIPKTFKVAVTDDLAPGLYEVWVVGKYGMSNSRLFVVSHSSEQVDRTPKENRQNAQPLSLGSTVNGRAVPNQKNFYRIFARKGQRVIGELNGEGIDSRIEAVLELYDPSGRLLQKDRTGQRLDYTPALTGPLFVAVSDLTYRGGEDYFYRLTLHSGPVFEFALPLSVDPQRTKEIHVFGRNLGSEEGRAKPMESRGGMDRLVYKFSGDQISRGSISLAGLNHSVPGFLGDRSFALSSREGVPAWPQARLRIIEEDSLVESDLLTVSEEIETIELPVRISGVFHPKYDDDAFEFEAKKGQEIWIEVQSSRLGRPTHPLVVVDRLQKRDGEYRVVEQVLELSKASRDLGQRSFPLRSLDPSGLLRVKQEGRYRITVSDRFNLTRDDPGRWYELQLRPPTPNFGAFSVSRSFLHRNIVRRAPVECSNLLPGQVLPIEIRLDPSDGFSGQVSVSAESSPQGVEVFPLLIPAGKTAGTLLISAGREASPIFGDLKLIAQSGDGDAAIVTSVEHGQVVWEVGDYNNERILSRLSPSRKISVSGGPAFPIQMRTEGGAAKVWSSSIAGQLSIPVELERHGEFLEAYSFKLGGHDGLAKHPGLTIKKGETTGVLDVDFLKYPLEPGNHAFYLYGEVKGKFRREAGADAKDVTVSVYSHPVQLEVFSAPFALMSEVEDLELRRGESKAIPFKVSRRFSFDGQIEVRQAFDPSIEGLNAVSGMLREDAFELHLSVSESSPHTQTRLKLTAQGKLNGKTVSAERVLSIRIVP